MLSNTYKVRSSYHFGMTPGGCPLTLAVAGPYKLPCANSPPTTVAVTLISPMPSAGTS
jgi:hypothetical protein